MANTRSAISAVAASLTARVRNVLDEDTTADVAVDLGDGLRRAFASGTTAGKADRCWSDKGRTLASGGDVQIDLFDFAAEDVGAGTGKDALGQAVGFVDVCALLAFNHADSVGNLILGGDQGEANAGDWGAPFGDTDSVAITIRPGGFLLLVAPTKPGYAVTDTSSHLLTCGASGGAITYDLHLLGRSA